MTNYAFLEIITSVRNWIVADRANLEDRIPKKHHK